MVDDRDGWMDGKKKLKEFVLLAFFDEDNDCFKNVNIHEKQNKKINTLLIIFLFKPKIINV